MRSFGNPEWVDNWTRGTGLRVEIMNTATADVWICQDEVDQDIVGSLALSDGFRVVGAAGLVADEAWFDRSPGSNVDGPLDTMQFGGLRFARVARPVGQEQFGPLTVLSIEKYHTMRYRAGRTIDVVDRGDGTVLTPAWAGARDCGVRLPEGWSIRPVELAGDLIARIPNPATVVMLADRSGFHGPVPRPLLDEVTA